jgi:predicted transcriptional regulator
MTRRIAYAGLVTTEEKGSDAANALEDVHAAYRQAVAAIETTEDPQQAFELASGLRDALDGLVGEAAELRAQMAYRVYKAEEISLATLATRLSVSKARADQFIRSARAAETTEGDH